MLKITPAHDPNDFEVGNRHNLERIKCINIDGTMNENAFIYKGLDRFECRKKLIDDLKEKDLLISIDEITHSVGHSERTDVMVEPYLSKQWFVNMRQLSKNVLDVQKQRNEKVNFIPERFEKILNHWMNDCHDCVYLDNYGGVIEFLLGIKTMKYMLVLIRQRLKDGIKIMMF